MSVILTPGAPASGTIGIQMIAGDVFSALGAALVTTTIRATDTVFLLRDNVLLTIAYSDLLAAMGGTPIVVVSTARHLLTPAGSRVQLPSGAYLAI